MNHKAGVALAFILAVIVAGVLGSIFQTQVNLADMRDIGPPISFAMRMDNTWHDLTRFAPIYTLIVLLTFAISFLLAEWIARKVPGHRMVWLVLAAIVSLAVSFQVIDAFAPMPTLIAATRSISGTLAMLLAAAIGALVYVLMTPQLNSPLDSQEQDL